MNFIHFSSDYIIGISNYITLRHNHSIPSNNLVICEIKFEKKKIENLNKNCKNESIKMNLNSNNK